MRLKELNFFLMLQKTTYGIPMSSTFVSNITTCMNLLLTDNSLSNVFDCMTTQLIS